MHPLATLTPLFSRLTTGHKRRNPENPNPGCNTHIISARAIDFELLDSVSGCLSRMCSGCAAGACGGHLVGNCGLCTSLVVSAPWVMEVRNLGFGICACRKILRMNSESTNSLAIRCLQIAALYPPSLTPSYRAYFEPGYLLTKP